jgi:DNA-binding NarL/FixJ family response regulator
MPESTGGDTRLTLEEHMALSLAATGLLDAEVARAMHVPTPLVRTWLASAVSKLGARSKLEAVVIADRTGQLTARP